MNFILEFLNHQMKRPEVYQGFSESWFQYLSLLIVVVLMIVLSLVYKNKDEEKVIRFIGMMSFIMIIFEVIKQINFSDANGWNYQWYAFPFQFCSTPMYVGLLLRYTKNHALKPYLMMFLATYGLFAGAAVMLYPVSVYVDTTIINIQTMVHHGSMAIMGVVLLSFHVPLQWKAFLKGLYVFIGLTGIAIILNIIHNTWIHEGTFNMFFINSKFSSEIPVLSLFQPLVPNIVYIMIFIVGFSLVAYIMLLIRKAFKTYKKGVLV
jgi:hypothetical protein